MQDKIIGATALRNGEELRVTISEFRGHLYAHVRRYYQTDAGQWRPGKGIALPMDLFPWTLARLAEAEAELIRAEKIGPEDYSNHGLELPVELDEPGAAA